MGDKEKKAKINLQKTERSALLELKKELSKKYKLLWIKLSPIIYSREEIDSPLTHITPFFKVIEKEGIFI